jgi:hypothetical protein
MMRLERLAGLLIAFSLLTSAATAHAECAWVLWVKTISVRSKAILGNDPWQSFRSLDECQKAEAVITLRR